MLGSRIFFRFEGNLEIVIFDLRIGELGDGIDVSPVASIDGKFSALDDGESVFSVKTHVNLPVLDRCNQVRNARWSRVHFEAAAFARRSERLARRVRWRVGRDHLYRVPAI